MTHRVYCYLTTLLLVHSLHHLVCKSTAWKMIDAGALTMIDISNPNPNPNANPNPIPNPNPNPNPSPNQEWAPRQGFHQLLDAYPWGALLLLSFRQGLFVGELIFHEPPSEEG